MATSQAFSDASSRPVRRPVRRPLGVSTTPHVWVGVIEWSSDTAEPPAVFVANSRSLVKAMAVHHLADAAVDFAGDPDFFAEHPKPDLTDREAVEAWLDDMHEATTAPWFTLYQVGAGAVVGSACPL